MRRKAQGFTLIEIMVVIAIIAGLVTTVAIMVPKMQETQRQLGCMNNLSQLGQVYKVKALESTQKANKYSGVALFLNMRKNADDIKRGDEKVLACPGDHAVRLPENDEDKKLWDNVDLNNPADNLCSYAGRDFQNHPIGAESKEKEIVGCDRQGPNGRTMHHRGVIICVFDAGDAQKFERSELGLASEQDIVVGPEADNPMLKKVAYIIHKKD
jgi:prepilin-type N-terminal cleavage/methylation domain-containing protein